MKSQQEGLSTESRAWKNLQIKVNVKFTIFHLTICDKAIYSLRWTGTKKCAKGGWSRLTTAALTTQEGGKILCQQLEDNYFLCESCWTTLILFICQMSIRIRTKLIFCMMKPRMRHTYNCATQQLRRIWLIRRKRKQKSGNLPNSELAMFQGKGVVVI